MMIAPLAASVIWKLLYDPAQGVFNRTLISLGLSGPDWLGGYHLALQSTIAVDVWLGVPFVFVVLLGGLESLPVEPFESAKIDGASAWQTVRRITIPMMRPLLLIAITFRIVWSFRNFGVIYGLTQGGPAGASETMIFRVWRVAFADLELGYAATIALLMAALILFVTILFVIGLSRQAAIVDGCSMTQVFVRIVLPLAFPGLVAATIFAAITSWNDFIYALVITGYNSATWPIFFTQYTGEVTIKWTQIAAGAVIVALPVVLLATAMQKFVTRGLTLGAIK